MFKIKNKHNNDQSRTDFQPLEEYNIVSHFSDNKEGIIKSSDNQVKSIIFNLSYKDCLSMHFSIYKKIMLVVYSLTLFWAALIGVINGSMVLFPAIIGALFLSGLLTVYFACFFIIDLIILWLRRKVVITQHHILFHEDHFVEQTSAFDINEYKWSTIRKIRENKHFIMIYVSIFKLHLIPKRIFASENECAEFLKFIKEKSNLNN
jgi:hypothetical protein